MEVLTNDELFDRIRTEVEFALLIGKQIDCIKIGFAFYEKILTMFPFNKYELEAKPFFFMGVNFVPMLGNKNEFYMETFYKDYDSL